MQSLYGRAMPTETDDERTSSPSGGRAGERIAKLLARAGIASRREIERMIEDRRIALDGVALETPATVLTSLHGVTVDGQPVAAPAPARLFLYHKPAGLLVTEHDPAGRPIIYDRLPQDLPRVVPVGRLDLATEGLLLLTTDGGLKRQLELPATGVERTYRARAYGDITQARLEELIDGIEIEGIRYGSIDANMERRTGANGWIEMTLTEGKNREVRRVLEYLGLQVSRLIRTRYGPFVLGDLMPGEVGEARQADLVGFRRAIENNRPKTEDRVSVAARPVAPPAPPPEPERPIRESAFRERAPAATTGRAPRDAGARGTKPSSGWGSRARPSRPTVAEERVDFSPTRARRPDGEPPRAETADGDRRRGAPPRADQPRSDQSRVRPPRGGDARGTGGERSERFSLADRPRGDTASSARPRGGFGGATGRSDRNDRFAPADRAKGETLSTSRPRDGANGAPGRADRSQRPGNRFPSDPRSTIRADRDGGRPERSGARPGAKPRPATGPDRSGASPWSDGPSRRPTGSGSGGGGGGRTPGGPSRPSKPPRKPR